jgi:hypothetical protein
MGNAKIIALGKHMASARVAKSPLMIEPAIGDRAPLCHCSLAIAAVSAL